ncbi:MAG: (Fe-S)-binding protein [Candidatus Njordarchaeales archaeon]
MSDYLPKVLLLIRNQIVKKLNPLGAPIKRCTKNLREYVCSDNCSTILYTGCMYYTMGLVSKFSNLIKLLTKNPTSERIVSLAEKFSGLSSLFLRMFSNKYFEQVPVKAIKILQKIGYSVSVLEKEPYSGALLHDLGFYDDLIRYGEKLRDFFKAKKVREIIVIDPHTYDLFVNVYAREIDGFDFEIINIVTILDEAIEEKKLELKSLEKIRVTYHDPCHYSKSLNYRIIEEPRGILNSIGNLELVEPFNTRELSICCGGPLEFVFRELSEEIARVRIKELEETGADLIVTACPICMSIFRSVRKNTKVVDLLDLVYDCLEG